MLERWVHTLSGAGSLRRGAGRGEGVPVHLVASISDQVGSSRGVANGDVNGSFPIYENVVVLRRDIANAPSRNSKNL